MRSSVDPTIQGEGPQIGVPCYFIRFGGCDFKCGWTGSEWEGFVCDSLHAVLPEEVRKAERLEPGEIISRVTSLPGAARLVVLSGGNPLLHDLTAVVRGLRTIGYKIAVETQGTLYKPWVREVDTLVISPKPPASHQGYTISNLQDFLDKVATGPGLVPKVVIKIPILRDEDLDFAREVAKIWAGGLFLSVTNVWGVRTIDPHVDTTEDLLARYRWILERTSIDPFLARATLLPQLHVLLWGNDRGR